MGQVCVQEDNSSSSSSHSMSLQRLLNSRMLELRRQFLPSSASSQERSLHLRRNLFGPIDHEENLRFVREEMDKLAQVDCQRWNFDFQSGKPLEGRYEWQEVDENVPQAYELPTLACRTSKAPSTTSNTTTSRNAPRRNGKSLKRLHNKVPGKGVAAAAATQKLCTDYFRPVKVSRRVCSSKQNIGNETPANTKSVNSKLSDVLKIRSMNVR
ncbi:uncharacterized protein [Panulirus ornatus]|uniref:uncharacterized protein n=1 Tax=Panulirus ornatus TaxID=150431 RepID=UPI003A85647C